MKAIIDGKRYDTETATAVADLRYPHAYDDFHYSKETLYKTRNFAWFLVVERAIFSKNGIPVGQDGHGLCKRIIPVSVAEAQTWLEQFNKQIALEEHFGASLQDAQPAGPVGPWQGGGKP